MVKLWHMNPDENGVIYKVRNMLCAESEDAVPQYLWTFKGTIQALSADEDLRPGAKVMDFGLLDIAPLFCDYHLHFSLKSDIAIEDSGRQLLCHGIGTVFDGGDKDCYGVSVRDKQKERPEIRSAGYALFRKGGYGAAIGQGVESVEGAVVAIDELQSRSVDYIKIINSGIFDPESGQLTSGGFDARELDRIVDHARSRGLDVYCHANGDRAVKDAVDAGVTAIIHGLHVSGPTLSAMAANNVSFIPTMNAFQSLGAVARSDRGHVNISSAVSGHMAAVRKAYDLGVKILPGSDAGPRFLPYGSSYLAELRLFEQAGIPYIGILRAASMTALQVNAPADFVVLDGLSVRSVVVNGKVLS
ncbi:MAG: amidohydrolase family protein [Nitrospirae bacterium]|nr:amidohydrolase family protein [Nitrospirota bacterium]